MGSIGHGLRSIEVSTLLAGNTVRVLCRPSGSVVPGEQTCYPRENQSVFTLVVGVYIQDHCTTWEEACQRKSSVTTHNRGTGGLSERRFP